MYKNYERHVLSFVCNIMCCW